MPRGVYPRKPKPKGRGLGFSSMTSEKRREAGRKGGLARQKQIRDRKAADIARARTLETANLSKVERQAKFRAKLQAFGMLIDESEYPLPILIPGDRVQLNPKGRKQFTTNRFEGAIFYGWSPRNRWQALLWVKGSDERFRKDNLFGGWLEKSPEGRALLCPRCGNPGHEAKDCPEVGDFGWEDAQYMAEARRSLTIRGALESAVADLNKELPSGIKVTLPGQKGPGPRHTPGGTEAMKGPEPPPGLAPAIPSPPQERKSTLRGESPSRLEIGRTHTSLGHHERIELKSTDKPYIILKAIYEDGTVITHGGASYALAALLLMDLYRIRSANVDIRIDDPVSWVHVLTRKEVK